MTNVDDARSSNGLGKLDQTDRQWSDNVQISATSPWQKLLGQAKGRTVMFAGAGHFGYGDSGKSYDGKTLNERLKEHGIGTTVIQFAQERVL